MCRKCRWWLYVVLGFAAGIVIYIVLPDSWILFLLCAAVIAVCSMTLFM